MIKLMPIFAGLLALTVVATPLTVKAGQDYQGKQA